MNCKLGLLLSLFSLFSMTIEAKVKLPSVLSDNMVIQREKPIMFWGRADAGENVSITIKKKTYNTIAGIDGRWKIELPSMKAGGPYTIKVNDIELKNVLIGDLWLCSGQSNMELPVSRVADLYAKETASYNNNMIRYVKTPYGNNLHGAKDDIVSMKWTPLTADAAQSFSALCYFFAKKMYEDTGVPVGIINSSWGGSSIEAWMSEDALKVFPCKLRERDIYNSDEYRKLCNKQSNMSNRSWYESLYKGDNGLHEATKWYDLNLDDSNWQTVDMFSDNLGTRNEFAVPGSHWFRQEVNLTAEQASKNVMLRLGRIYDADSTFVNGVYVGNITYQYPPRKYMVPASVLKPGKNVIAVRIICGGGHPQFIKDKPYCFAWDNDTVRLSRQWKYRLGCEMPVNRGGVSFQNVPTGMFNSMISPLLNLKFKGVIWYQGETNTGRYDEYESLLTAMIEDWRKKFNNNDLPFFIMQLPNYMNSHSLPTESGWAATREAQRQVSLKVPNTDISVAIDLGEWNDIHPLNKKDLAYRISLLVNKRVYGQKKIIAQGPVLRSVSINGDKLIVSFENGTDDLLPVDTLRGFAIAGSDGRYQWADAKIIDGNKIEVSNKNIKNPVMIRYAWDDNPSYANLRNRAGLPASPFEFSYK